MKNKLYLDNEIVIDLSWALFSRKVNDIEVSLSINQTANLQDYFEKIVGHFQSGTYLRESEM